MADRFRSLDVLIAVVEGRSFSRPPALVSNAHTTGLGVARALADDLGVPYPGTYRVDETLPEPADADGIPPVRTAEEAADALGFPLVVKPALEREFEEAVGTNVIEVADRREYAGVVDRARTAGIRIMAQEKVPVAAGEDRSLVSYVPPDGGEPVAVVGNPTRYPTGYGTSCLVERVDEPVVEERALAVLDAAGYHGISEAEFVYDGAREEYVLLDVNTRPWKWIGLPVAAGANLPAAAYAEAVGGSYEPDPIRDATWVYLRDYLALLAEGGTDVFGPEQWRSLVSGGFEAADGLTTGVYAPSDPGPAVQLLSTEFSTREYYCSC